MPAGRHVSAPDPEATRPPTAATSPRKVMASASWSKRGLPLTAVVVILGVVAYLDIGKPWISKPSVSSSTVAVNAAPAAFTPPPHSIAVLPFVNLSGDKDQEYFSEGLTEELLNSLTEINGLQVSGRTSAFSFQGKDADVGAIARKLNVGAILEGSVRRSGHTVRITVQLINAVTGFEVWSRSYDRNLRDVLKLQTEIATAVADSLKVALLGDIAAKIELGGTRNAAAFNAYLRASSSFQAVREGNEIPAAIAEYTDAIHLDPSYALAFADRSIALTSYAGYAATGAAVRESLVKAEADARRAIALAPELAEAHLALAYASLATLDFAQANTEYERALVLAPGKAEVLRESGVFAASMGHFDEAVAATRRAVVLDPLDPRSYEALGIELYAARRYKEAAKAYTESISLNPNYKLTYGRRGLAFYEADELGSARTSCETQPNNYLSQVCLAVVYDKLGRHADAQAELAKMIASLGDAGSSQYATVYAQWGDRSKALEWLDTAMRVRDPGLISLKTDPLLDPVRQEPRFQAILRELKFPQ
ncbi:MAG: tetratricopeptide repeat protein [Steroidobacteraceae bacterium]